MFLFLVLSFSFNTSLHNSLGMTMRLRALGSRLLLSNSHVTTTEMVCSEMFA